MSAAVEDFLGGMLRECAELAAEWRHRRPPGLDRRLARLSGWSPLARLLPPELEGPNGPELNVEPTLYRRLWGEARGLAALAAAPPLTPASAPALVEQLYPLMASRSDPPHPFVDDAVRAVVVEWANVFLQPGGDLPRAAMAFVNFVRRSPLGWGNEAVAALLAAALPAASGDPLLLVLNAADRAEEGYHHALEAALDGDDAAWIAFYLGKARRALKRLPKLAEGTEALRRRWINLFARADFGPEVGEALAEALLALPVITPAFVADTGIATNVLRDGLVLLFAADDAVEVRVADQGFTLLPAVLRLLV